MSDPVKIGAEALLGPIESRRDPKTLGGQWDRQQAPCAARSVLEALHEAGWRIVRTSTCACGVADDAHDPNHERYPTDERIVDEWTPEADRG